MATRLMALCPQFYAADILLVLIN